MPSLTVSLALFLSTPSARRATGFANGPTSTASYFYPRPPRGGRLLGIPEFLHQRIISIHALREEGDIMAAIRDFSLVLFLSTPSARRATDAPLLLQYGVGISIHALREEGDVIFGGCLIDDLNFYPRPPRGGRLLFLPVFSLKIDYFYPRPPRGGRLFFPHNRVWRVRISIHALREEGDALVNQAAKGSRISIHALREEGDKEVSAI